MSVYCVKLKSCFSSCESRAVSTFSSRVSYHSYNSISDVDRCFSGALFVRNNRQPVAWSGRRLVGEIESAPHFSDNNMMRSRWSRSSWSLLAGSMYLVSGHLEAALFCTPSMVFCSGLLLWIGHFPPGIWRDSRFKFRLTGSSPSSNRPLVARRISQNFLQQCFSALSGGK